MRRFGWFIAAGWTLFVLLGLAWNWDQSRDAVHDLALTSARLSFEKDVVYRQWNATHGGVYVPVTEESPPNPHLSHLPDRDVTTLSGKRLTLVNPAYMTRQVHELGAAQYGLKGHITSLDPIRPENAADPWERSALTAFEEGTEEVVEDAQIDGELHLRLMRPMLVEKPCLKCHASQGYAIGDIRGGVSVSVPLNRYVSHLDEHHVDLLLWHGLLWLTGLLGVGLMTARLVSMTRTENARRGEAKDRIGESEARYRSYVDNAPFGVFIADETGRYVEVNPEACRITGYSEEELLARTIPDLLPEHGLEAGLASFVEVQQTGRTTVELPFRPKSGSERVWVVNAVKISERSILGFTQDITVKREMEAKLADSEARYRNIFEKSTDGILLADAETRTFIEANDVICSLLGYERDELLGRSVMDIHPPEKLAMVQEEFGRQLRGETQVSTELPVLRKDGTVFPADINSSPVTIANRPVLVGHFRDVSERVRTDVEKKRMEVRTRHLQKLESVGVLASGVAHEINNPLAVMMNFGELILDDGESTETLREYAGMIVTEGERVATIVRALLTFARPDLHGTGPEHLGDVAQAVVSLVRTMLLKDGIAVETRIVEDLPRVTCHGQRIQQVLMNLLTNARDALNERYPSRSEEKRIIVTVSRFEEDGATWVRTTVEDRAGGIPAEVADRIFDPFFSTKAKHEGTGIGLSISHGIVQEHDGRLWFETEPGEGTRFHMDLRAGQGLSASPVPLS